MTLKIIKDKTYNKKVLSSEIHGKYPYKLYLEIKGNTNIGRYIVVVSDKQLNATESIDEITIQLNNSKISILKRINNSTENQQNNRPGILSKECKEVSYKVKEANVLQLDNIELMVFKPVQTV